MLDWYVFVGLLDPRILNINKVLEGLVSEIRLVVRGRHGSGKVGCECRRCVPMVRVGRSYIP